MRIYKEKIEKKKLADQLIIKDFHLVPMITNSNDISNYTYFKVNNLKDWELLKEAYNIHSLKMDIKNFPEIIIGGSSFDLEDKKIYYSISTYESFEMELDYILWYKLSTIQQDMINYWKSLGYKAVFEKYDFPKHDQRKKVEKNFYNGQHVWLVSDNTYLSELYLRSCDRPAYEILEGMIREKNQKNVKVEVASERIDNLLNFMLDGERDTEFGIKEADYGNRVLCTSREDAEKYIEKTKLILEIHSAGFRSLFKRRVIHPNPVSWMEMISQPMVSMMITSIFPGKG